MFRGKTTATIQSGLKQGGKPFFLAFAIAAKTSRTSLAPLSDSNAARGAWEMTLRVNTNSRFKSRARATGPMPSLVALSFMARAARGAACAMPHRART